MLFNVFVFLGNLAFSISVVLVCVGSFWIWFGSGIGLEVLLKVDKNETSGIKILARAIPEMCFSLQPYRLVIPTDTANRYDCKGNTATIPVVSLDGYHCTMGFYTPKPLFFNFVTHFLSSKTLPHDFSKVFVHFSLLRFSFLVQILSNLLQEFTYP